MADVVYTFCSAAYGVSIQGSVQGKVEHKSLGAQLRAVWASQIAGLQGVSAGVVRALGAHADGDAASVLASIEAAAEEWGPASGARMITAWSDWYPAFVKAEIARLLSELQERWPTPAERVRREIVRQRRQRWADDGARIVEEAAASASAIDVLRDKLQLRKRRFDALILALEAIGAVRVAGVDARLIVLATPDWVRERLLARSVECQ